MNTILIPINFSAAPKLLVDPVRACVASYTIIGPPTLWALLELIAGNTTNRVLKKARCPVITIPVQTIRTNVSPPLTEVLHV